MTADDDRAYVIEWRSLRRWDLKSARAAAFSESHPSFQPFGNFIEEALEIVRPMQRPEKEWPVYGVNNRDGVTFSHLQKGEAFNSPYKRIRKDWFFHNPTRANVGSLGRVPQVTDDAITSPEYQVWRIKGGLLPDFVEILIRMPFFRYLIECHRVGAVKERLFVENLREIPIPVLAIRTQRAIVAHWRKAQKEIANIRDRVDKLKDEIDQRFITDLGLKSPDTVSSPRAFAALWENFHRWGVAFNFLNQSGADLSLGKYPVVELVSVLEMVQYGTSEKANTSRDGVAVIRMNNVVDGELDLFNLKHVVLTDFEVEKLLLKKGDILFNRTNSKELVGKCATFQSKGNFVFASYLIRVRADSSKADPDFLCFVINSAIGRQQINTLSRQIIGQANINSQELRSLKIPIPLLRVQKQIMGRVATGRAKIAREREAADKLEQEINADIEALILGAKTLREE